MNFYFCSKCNKRVTDVDLQSGQAIDKQAAGIFCRQCAEGIRTSEFTAITNTPDKKKPSVNAVTPVARTPLVAERQQSSIKMAPAPSRGKSAPPVHETVPVSAVVGGVSAVIVVSVMIVLLTSSSKPVKENRPDPSPPPRVAERPRPSPEPLRPERVSPPVEKSAPQPAPRSPTENGHDGPALHATPPATPPVAPPVPPAPPVEAEPPKKAPPSTTEEGKPTERMPVAPSTGAEKKDALSTLVDLKGPRIIYAQFQDEFYVALCGGDTQLAEQRLAQAEKNPALMSMGETLKQDRLVLKWMGEMDKALLRGIEKLKEIDNFELRLQVGAPIRVGKRAPFQLNSVADGKMDVGAEGVSMTISIDKLQTSTYRRIQVLGFPDDGPGQIRRGFIQLLEASSEPALLPAVSAALDKAKKSGAPEEEYAALDRLRRPVELNARELAAGLAWDEFNRLAGDKQFSRMALLPLLRAFKLTFADTACFTKRREQLKTVSTALAAELGLLMYLSFDDKNAVADDFSGRGNDGKVFGAPQWIEGKFGGALKFDGVQDYILLPDEIIFAHKTLTISFWFNTKAAEIPILGYQGAEVLNAEVKTFVPIFYIGDDGRLRGKVWDGTVNSIISPKAVNDGAWHQVTLTAKESTQSLYLDGSSIGTIPGEILPLDMKKNQLGAAHCFTWPAIGGKHWTFFSGLLDDFRLYDRELGAQDVQALFNASPKSP
jgi:hypothetical protein